MEDIENFVWLEGLKNAIKFNGKASAKAILGKLMKEHAELRSQSQTVQPLIEQIIDEINTMDLDSQKERALLLDEHALDKQEKAGPEKKVLPDLPNTSSGNCIFRLAPFPSGPLHIGNARMIVLNDEYAKRYNGKLILVFDDTIGTTQEGLSKDPEKAKFVLPEAYDLIREGLQWLGVTYHEEIYKSDRVKEGIYEQEAQYLIEHDNAYVCVCDANVFRENKKSIGWECEDRNLTVDVNLDRFDKMKSGEYGEGKAVVRLKTGMDQKDPAMRDPVIMRISDAEHPRIGSSYRLWPNLEFSWGLDDHLLGITHIIRGIDLKKEGEIENFISDIHGWEKPHIQLFGMLHFEESEFKLSKTFMRKQVQSGVYDGWSDPRTWSLQSLEMRGIRPEALREALIELGLSNRNIAFDKSWVYAKNKHIIDPIADRYWFVENARKLVVTNIPFDNMVAAPLINPSNENSGTREVPIVIEDGVCEFYIAAEDLDDVVNAKGGIIHPAIQEGDVIRLKDMFNIIITELSDPIQSEFHSKEKEVDSRKIQAVPVKDNIPVRVLQPDGKITQGFGEANLRNIEPKSIIQFERYGYVRVINISSEEVYCYFINE